MICLTDEQLAQRDAEVRRPLEERIVQLTARVPDAEFMIEFFDARQSQVYDYAVASAYIAVQNVLDGKDNGDGVANQPWETQRRKLLALVAEVKRLGDELSRVEEDYSDYQLRHGGTIS